MATGNVDVSQFLDISNPESHCNQGHDHFALPWPLPACDWWNQLAWSMGDTGYNEGAAAGARIALEYGLNLPPQIASLGGDLLANAWPRRDMMRFAIDIAKAGFLPQGTSIAIASQWHNCHAFKCLVFHAPEVGAWLLQQ